MTIATAKTPLTLPDHTQLPESDSSFVFAQRLPWSQNFQEHPQSILLTSAASRHNFRVNRSEFTACIIDFHLPIHPPLSLVDIG
jgi:hypothetical protein